MTSFTLSKISGYKLLSTEAFFKFAVTTVISYCSDNEKYLNNLPICMACGELNGGKK